MFTLHRDSQEWDAALEKGRRERRKTGRKREGRGRKRKRMRIMVFQEWNRVAENDHLWRNLCLKKWSFCNFSKCLGSQTWKQFFLKQTKQEYQMALVQPEDFIFKEATGNLGIIGPMAYLSGNGPTMGGREKSIICTVSSKHMLYAWDVQEGTMIWSSPVQQSSITHLATLPQMYLAFTVDLEGTVKVWNCQDQDALATFPVSQACFSLEVCLTKDGPFLMVGNSEGDIYTLTVPELRGVSKVHAFKYTVDLLHCSPDKKWVFASGTHQNILPRVFFTECLLKPSEGKSPLSLSIPFSSCCRACWAPRRTSRITLMYRRGSSKKTGFTTFDLMAERTGGRTVIQVGTSCNDLRTTRGRSAICGRILCMSSPHLWMTPCMCTCGKRKAVIHTSRAAVTWNT
ncbi:F-box/WD repeat-containing protein 12 isoform X3 [Leopardus geoffroyi]|uniref:F-box/WD repeat-containing protein 12 isoform X3 n=1 Tax=Leopardus geoffroyi TaxID=46844 RepID=UPI001E262947|nr:F-box/WD repeat-containing protein 12 isoform X3 [Leopardus geoffroyi]XP_045348749.1 F-box/WD repeat-containing protein 12 isoform X3 [Leopardus geoffroyi]